MFLHRSRHATLARLTAATFPAITLACPLSDHLHSPFCRFISLILCVFSCLLVVSPPPRLGLLHLFPFPNLKLHFSPTESRQFLLFLSLGKPIRHCLLWHHPKNDRRTLGVENGIYSDPFVIVTQRYSHTTYSS